MSGPPDFTIITPSLNDLGFLRRCCASVIDQQGISLEHLVIDGGSTDGTREWLNSATGPTPLFGRDGGMYEALNEGLDRATGTWVGFLNCDEQYLPGALRAVVDFADRNPGIGSITGDFIVVRPDGALICQRKETVPRPLYIRVSYLYTFTCALFIRREVLGSSLRFEASFKAAGDEEFVQRVLKHIRPGHLAKYLAAFTDRPEAVGRSAQAQEETRLLRKRNPFGIALLAPLLRVGRHLEKAAAGGYARPGVLTYDLFVDDECRERRSFSVSGAPWRWGRR